MDFFSELMLSLIVMGLVCCFLYGGYQVFLFLTKGIKRKELSYLETMILIILAIILGNMFMSLAIKG